MQMPRTSRFRRWAAAVVAVLVAQTVVQTVVPTPTTAAPAPKAPLAVAKPAASVTSVTLITGDVVGYRGQPGGKDSVMVLKGRPGVRYQYLNSPNGWYVLPSDALPLVSARTVDRELVQRQLPGQERVCGPRSVHRAGVDRLPGCGGSYAGRRGAWCDHRSRSSQHRCECRTSGQNPGRHLLADDRARRWVEPCAGRWRGQAPAGPAGQGDSRGQRRANWRAAGLGRRLRRSWRPRRGTGHRRRRHPSGPRRQGGRREEFRRGRAGSGRSQRSRYARRLHGRAGTGAASGGKEKGVAPGAELVIGKVLDGGGLGYDSDIIAGMEWAATTEHARVVSMSLGGAATDGDDPMADAVQSLTASTGALFVIAAGNSGPTRATIGSPGDAEDALTVGAVDSHDQIAEFSSRGPGRGATVKPEVVAPGVDIVAARAAGTSLGTPVNQYYTTLSGTSMGHSARRRLGRHPRAAPPGLVGRAAQGRSCRCQQGHRPARQRAGRRPGGRASGPAPVGHHPAVDARLRCPAGKIRHSYECADLPQRRFFSGDPEDRRETDRSQRQNDSRRDPDRRRVRADRTGRRPGGPTGGVGSGQRRHRQFPRHRQRRERGRLGPGHHPGRLLQRRCFGQRQPESDGLRRQDPTRHRGDTLDSACRR